MFLVSSVRNLHAGLQTISEPFEEMESSQNFYVFIWVGAKLVFLGKLVVAWLSP